MKQTYKLLEVNLSSQKELDFIAKLLRNNEYLTTYNERHLFVSMIHDAIIWGETVK
jgi:hypothetical protein